MVLLLDQVGVVRRCGEEAAPCAAFTFNALGEAASREEDDSDVAAGVNTLFTHS